MPTDDAGASPATCPRCGRVGVDCEDEAAIERAVMAFAEPRRAWSSHHILDAIPRIRAAIRAFLGCPR